MISVYSSVPGGEVLFVALLSVGPPNSGVQWIGEITGFQMPRYLSPTADASIVGRLKTVLCERSNVAQSIDAFVQYISVSMFTTNSMTDTTFANPKHR